MTPPNAARSAEPTRTAREFKRRLGDPTPIILGGTPYGAEALIAQLLQAIVARVTTQLGSPPDSIVVTHPANYGAYKIDLLEQAIRQADIDNVTLLTEPEAAAIHYAGQERVPPGRSSPSTTSAAAPSTPPSCARPRTASSSSAGPRASNASAASTSTRRSSPRSCAMVRADGATIDPNDPATLAAIARLREECRRAKEALSSDTDTTIPGGAAGPPHRGAPDPRGIRGDDPAAHHRDDRRAGAGPPRAPASTSPGSTGSCSSVARPASRSSRSWSARPPGGRSRSTRIRSTRWRSRRGARRRDATKGSRLGRHRGRRSGGGGRGDDRACWSGPGRRRSGRRELGPATPR